MRRAVLLSLALVHALAAPAWPVEYRLQVAHLHDKSFTHFLEGKIGRGQGELAMTRLGRDLDLGRVGKGAFLNDRDLRVATQGTAAAFRASVVKAEIMRPEGQRLWEETVWDGQPGGRSVWIIAPVTFHDQEVTHLALGGRGPLRYHIPYTVSGRPLPAPAASFPLQLLWFYGERGNLWDRYLARTTGFQDGLAVVVGVHHNPSAADWVYIITEHLADPTPFKVVVAWDRRRSADQSLYESPAWGDR